MDKAGTRAKAMGVRLPVIQLKTKATGVYVSGGGYSAVTNEKFDETCITLPQAGKVIAFPFRCLPGNVRSDGSSGCR